MSYDNVLRQVEKHCLTHKFPLNIKQLQRQKHCVKEFGKLFFLLFSVRQNFGFGFMALYTIMYLIFIER